MKSYNIWVEGYRATGEQGTAIRICSSVGENFTEACKNAYEAGKFKGYGNFDPEHLTLWACHLFPNETEARRQYG